MEQDLSLNSEKEKTQEQTVTETLPTDEKLYGEPDISREDTTPPIKDQAQAKGFTAEVYNFGLLEGDGSEYFNPAIVQRNDGYWLLTRRSEPHPKGFRFGQNNIWAFMLDETGKVPKMGKLLRWPTDDAEQHFEDPRGFFHPGVNQTAVGACTFVWYPDRSWTGAHQCFGLFDEEWHCKSMVYPKIGGNPGQMGKIQNTKDYEKNWLYWLHDNSLHVLYKADPWKIVAFGHVWTESKTYEWTQGGVKWPWGTIRGGTNPVRVGDYYFTFHHSSLPWKGRYRRYYAGCLAFDAAPPFRPRLITKEPLLAGSQNDIWTQRKPLVVFPCGAVIKDNHWLVSLGVNDMRAAWMEIEHEHLLSMMVSVDQSSDQIFGANGLSEGELKGGDATWEKKQSINSSEDSELTQISHAESNVQPADSANNLSGDATSRPRSCPCVAEADSSPPLVLQEQIDEFINDYVKGKDLSPIGDKSDEYKPRAKVKKTLTKKRRKRKSGKVTCLPAEK